jgi:hypothetical protein
VLCFLCGTDWILKCYLHELRLQRVKLKTRRHCKSIFSHQQEQQLLVS